MKDHRTIPSLALLRCFEVAAKYQSFSAAAEELGLSQGAVSRHVKDLEAYVGAALFQREGRGVRLTSAGEALASEVSTDLERLRDTFSNAIASGARREVIRLSAPPTFSSRWLLPRLPNFQRDHPDIQFMVSSRQGPYDLTEARHHIAIHFGAWDWPNARLSPLCPESLIVVAAPSLLETLPAKDKLNEVLRDVPRVHLSSRPYLWEKVMQLHGVKAEAVRSGSYFDQFGLVISAVVAGMGAAILPAYLIERELSAGSLVKLSELPADDSRRYFIATPLTDQWPIITEFARWLQSQVSAKG